MAKRFFIHAGFHKTGTTSFQHFVKSNQEVLSDILFVQDPKECVDLFHASGGYSATLDSFHLAKFASRAMNIFENLDIGDKTFFLSSEKLSGHLPGRGDIRDWSAAPELMDILCQVIHGIFPNAQINILYTVRPSDEWFESAYYHLLRSTRMTLEYGKFLSTHSGAAKFDIVFDEIRKKIAPHKLHVRDINLYKNHRLGVGEILGEILEFDDDLMSNLTPTEQKNNRPVGDLYDKLLQANRTIDDQDELVKFKKAEIRYAREQHEKRNNE